MYIREEKEEKFEGKLNTLGNSDYLLLNSDNYNVGFCGKVYPIVRLSKNTSTTYKVLPNVVKYCNNAQDIHDFVNEHCREKEIQKYSTKNKYSWFNSFSFDKFGVERFFEEGEKQKDKHNCLFEKAPIFVIYRHYHNDSTITYNARLKDVDFFRVFDAYTTFQELSMYMANKAIPMKPIPEMDDATKIALKGFDKFSFRKDKSK